MEEPDDVDELVVAGRLVEVAEDAGAAEGLLHDGGDEADPGDAEAGDGLDLALRLGRGEVPVARVVAEGDAFELLHDGIPF